MKSYYKEDFSGNKKTYWTSVLSLLGHLAGTAVIFVTFFTIGWIVSFLLYYLHGVHPFPEEILNVITKIELVVVYADALLCGIVLIAGMLRFFKEFWREINEK